MATRLLAPDCAGKLQDKKTLRRIRMLEAALVSLAVDGIDDDVKRRMRMISFVVMKTTLSHHARKLVIHIGKFIIISKRTAQILPTKNES